MLAIISKLPNIKRTSMKKANVSSGVGNCCPHEKPAGCLKSPFCKDAFVASRIVPKSFMPIPVVVRRIQIEVSELDNPLFSYVYLVRTIQVCKWKHGVVDKN